MPRETSIISPIARSATQSLSTSGVLPTGMPRSAAAPRSILSTPTPKLEITFSYGKASISAASAKPAVARPMNSRPRAARKAFGSASSTRRCQSKASASCFSSDGISLPYCKTSLFHCERSLRVDLLAEFSPLDVRTADGSRVSGPARFSHQPSYKTGIAALRLRPPARRGAAVRGCWPGACASPRARRRRSWLAMASRMLSCSALHPPQVGAPLVVDAPAGVAAGRAE